MQNAMGRLARAYTCCNQGANITDLGLSYSKRGETSDVYESTPNSNGYYHVSETYWANGAVDQLNAPSCSSNPCLPGLTSFTYAPDGEGRTNTVSAGSGQNPVTGTNYNLYNSPPQITVTFGSGDSDIFNLDPNTGRMTQYQFKVGAQPQSVVGALTWNVNGSLGGLSITDPFNSGDVQTCTYVHDDLERIGGSSTTLGVNCVNGSQTVWSNYFTYDPFGNINKSGSSSFNPSYSAATNRMTQIGSCTPTYDSNGDVTNDCLNTYTWDANGRPLTINGVGTTYDALGRMVELKRSGVYTQIVYDPTGNKLALMNGQSLVKAFVPLTGGATAVYTTSGLDHYRHSDWLGSARLMTSPTQTVLGDVAYSPFGETYAQSGIADFSFTGMNEDAAANTNPALIYDFPAREYGIQGRWPSPDPMGIGAANPSNPQTWNRYAYVMNNPLAAMDPTGLFYPGVVLVNPADGGPCWVCDALIGIFDFFDFLFSLFSPPPQAAPPPPGGYGTGIDASGDSGDPVPSGVSTGVPCTVYGDPCPPSDGINWWGVGGGVAAGAAGGAAAASAGGQTSPQTQPNSQLNACSARVLQQVQAHLPGNPFLSAASPTEVGGHFNFLFGLSTPGSGVAQNLATFINSSSGLPFDRGIRFGLGPSLHVVDASSFDSATLFLGHLDLFNPLGLYGLEFVPHVVVDVVGGHIVQFFGGSLGGC
jgi:RHS repeat-associated protein